MQHNLPLTEKYRPQAWEEVVGQAAAMKKLAVLRQRGLGGRVFFITDPSGSGKTTIARLIAKELTIPYAIYEMDAQRLSLADVRDFDKMCRCKPLGGS